MSVWGKLRNLLIKSNNCLKATTSNANSRLFYTSAPYPPEMQTALERAELNADPCVLMNNRFSLMQTVNVLFCVCEFKPIILKKKK